MRKDTLLKGFFFDKQNLELNLFYRHALFMFCRKERCNGKISFLVYLFTHHPNFTRDDSACKNSLNPIVR